MLQHLPKPPLSPRANRCRHCLHCYAKLLPSSATATQMASAPALIMPLSLQCLRASSQGGDPTHTRVPAHSVAHLAGGRSAAAPQAGRAQQRLCTLSADKATSLHSANLAPQRLRPRAATHLAGCSAGRRRRRRRAAAAAQLEAPLQDRGAVVRLGLLGQRGRQARLQRLHLARQLRKLGLLALAEALLRLRARAANLVFWRSRSRKRFCACTGVTPVSSATLVFWRSRKRFCACAPRRAVQREPSAQAWPPCQARASRRRRARAAHAP